MRQLKTLTVGLFAGTIIGALVGVALPETRAEPVAVAIFTVCGSIAGAGIGFAYGLIRRSDEERKRGPGLEGFSEAASWVLLFGVISIVRGLVAGTGGEGASE